MKHWKKGDTCYFTGITCQANVGSFPCYGKGIITATIEDVDECNAFVNVSNGYDTPWLKKLSDLFDTPWEAEEMLNIEYSETPAILDIVGVQPMTTSTPGTPSMIWKTYATNSTSSDDTQSSTLTGDDTKDIIGSGKS